jgi:AraC-like DNA-binding protein
MVPEQAFFPCGCPRAGFAEREAGTFAVRRGISTRRCGAGEHDHVNARLVLTVHGTFATRHGTWSAMLDCDRVLFRPAGDMHSDDYPDATLSISLGLDTRDRRTARLGTAPFVRADDAIAGIARDVSKELDRDDALSPFVIDALGAELVERVVPSGDATDTGLPRWLRAVREMLHECYSEPPALCEIARLVDREPTYVAAAFKRYFGTTVGAYVRALRVHRARALISDGERTFAEAAQQSGFADQSHFTRAFRSTYAVTPGDYRRRMWG